MDTVAAVAAVAAGEVGGLGVPHLLRGVAVELGPRSARFANQNGMHPTGAGAPIGLMGAAPAGGEMTAGRLGRVPGLDSAGTTAPVDRLERARRAGQVRRMRGERDRCAVDVEVDQRAVEPGRSFFGPLIGRTVEPIRGHDEREPAAIGGFLGGVYGTRRPRGRRAPGANPIAYESSGHPRLRLRTTASCRLSVMDPPSPRESRHSTTR